MTFEEIKKSYEIKKITKDEVADLLKTRILDLEGAIKSISNEGEQIAHKEQIERENISKDLDYTEYLEESEKIAKKSDFGKLIKKGFAHEQEIRNCKIFLSDIELDTENANLESLLNLLSEKQKTKQSSDIELIKIKIDSLIEKRIHELNAIRESVKNIK